MNFNKKLQELRKQEGLTQEDLAQKLYVSRAAIYKWESGRGYPNIDSLKAIANLFSITVDELLSGNELLDLLQEENKQKTYSFRDLVFGLLDISALMLLFLPFFAGRQNGIIQPISLISLSGISTYLKAIYFILLVLLALSGIIILSLQNCRNNFWLKSKYLISIILNTICAFIFIVGLHPYASIYLFVFLLIKFIILIKK